jgi:NAD(P)-dependent dehydrogenase (short-subunit alcohol dehydrogenase family)
MNRNEVPTARNLQGKVAWVTGAGSGIGEAAALALAGEGATVVLTGRREPLLEEVARAVKEGGGRALVQPGDLTRPATAPRLAKAIHAKLGRIDILVNNAGTNILKRSWRQLGAEGATEVLEGNLSSAFHCVLAVLPIMRAQGRGLLIHTASWAGRFVGLMSGPAYVAAKHGVVAMSHSINMEECVNGIRSTVVCPGEVATPILDQRPVPVSKEDRARMLQAEDVGDLIRYIALLPPYMCLNEVLVSPTWNRGYVAALKQPHVKV